MNKIISYLVAFLLIAVAVTGCSSPVNTEVADTTDETVLTPPEQEEGYVGIWAYSDSALVDNTYIYGGGKLVSFIQDSEEETWCVLAYWNKTDDNILTTSEKAIYKYNESSGSWDEVTEEVGIKEAKDINEKTFTATEMLPNGNEEEITFDRTNGMTIDIPDEAAITLIINNFTIH